MRVCFVVVKTDLVLFFFFFFNDTATTEIYTLSLHDALPIADMLQLHSGYTPDQVKGALLASGRKVGDRSEEHTSELQSQSNLVCRLLLEKKKKKKMELFPSSTNSIK